MKSYDSYDLKELKSLNDRDDLVLTQDEFRSLITNKNIKYFKFLDENKIYIKLIGFEEDYLIIYIERGNSQ